MKIIKALYLVGFIAGCTETSVVPENNLPVKVNVSSTEYRTEEVKTDEKSEVDNLSAIKKATETAIQDARLACRSQEPEWQSIFSFLCGVEIVLKPELYCQNKFFNKKNDLKLLEREVCEKIINENIYFNGCVAQKGSNYEANGLDLWISGRSDQFKIEFSNCVTAGMKANSIN